MNGIDISSHQTGINLSAVPCDFVIIKATQGTSYVNGDLRRQYAQAVQNGKKVGLFHYASKGGATAEANHFLALCNELKALGSAILCLDWEWEANANFGDVSYAKQFLDFVYASTRITPFIYMSKSVCRSSSWSGVAKRYPLWAAQYADKKETGYRQNPWTDNLGFGSWAIPLIYQYSSKGRLPGYNGNLDLDLAYLTPTEWDAWARGDQMITEPFAGTVTNIKTGLCVRTAPSLSAPLVQVCGQDFYLPDGMCVAFEAEADGWAKLSGFDGWCSLSYIKR